MVIIQFELLTKLMDYSYLNQVDSSIQKLNTNKSIISILCVLDELDAVLKEPKLKNSTFKLVGDGRNFNKRYNIISFPTIMVLDPKGRVCKYFKNREQIDLESIIKE